MNIIRVVVAFIAEALDIGGCIIDFLVKHV